MRWFRLAAIVAGVAILGAWQAPQVPDPNAKDEKTRQQTEMTAFINATYFPKQAEVACWTCHRGEPIPASFKRDDEATARVAKMINLPADAADKPAGQVFKNIQKLKSVPAGRI